MRIGSSGRSQVRRGSGGLVCQSKEEKVPYHPQRGRQGKPLPKGGSGGKGEGKAKTTRKNGEKKAGKLSKCSKGRERRGRGKHARNKQREQAKTAQQTKKV